MSGGFRPYDFNKALAETLRGPFFSWPGALLPFPFVQKIWIARTFRPKISSSMRASTFIARALVVLGLAAGCRASECLHPYNDCGPVFYGPENCNPNYRAGSILNAPQSRGTASPPSTMNTAPVE